MKKLLSLILCLILCLTLFACDQESEASETNATKASTAATSNTSESTSNNSKEEDKTFSPAITIEDLQSLKVESDYLNKTFTRFVTIDTIEKILSYINGLEIKKASTPPEGEATVIMTAAYYGRSTKLYFFETGKTIGISNKYHEEYGAITWYYVCNTDIVKPIDFLHTVYTPIKIVNGKLDFGEKKVISVSLLNYQGVFDPAEHVDELSFKDTYNFEKIMTFFKNFEFKDPIIPEETYGGNEYRYFRFYFENGSYFSIYFMDETYFNAGGKIYPLTMAQLEELYEFLSDAIWNWK